ncbi:MAG: hypothetical protein FWD69_08860 [Polyangiaceae bacterium]|nr:hypothetical protein [Polyangiaceae bacterium]
MSTPSQTGFCVLEDSREALLFNAHTGAYFRLTARAAGWELPLRRAAIAGKSTLAHMHALATAKSWAEAFDLATRLALLPVYEVYLPATAASLGRAIHDVTATQPS